VRTFFRTGIAKLKFYLNDVAIPIPNTKANAKGNQTNEKIGYM
jgi:hypothetical protein